MDAWQRHEAPAPWWEHLSMDTATPAIGAAVPMSHFPLPGWPASSTVEYLTKLIVLGLLLLALPYLIGKLLTSPADVLMASTNRAMKTALP
jgi:hypothetical protein